MVGTPVGIMKVSAVFVVIGAAGTWYGYTHGNGKDSISGFSMLIGATVVIMGLGMGLQSIGEVLRYRKVTRGEGVLAKWTVTPDEWQSFLEFNERHEKAGSLRAVLPRNKRRRTAPVEMMITAKSVMIDGAYHELLNSTYYRSIGPYWAPGPPAYLEYQVVCDGPDTSDRSEFAYRLPVGAVAVLSQVKAQPLA